MYIHGDTVYGHLFAAVPPRVAIDLLSLTMADSAIRTTKWKEVTLEEALDDDWDMIPPLTAFAKTREYCQYLDRNRIQLERIISRHLGMPSTDFVLLSQDHWVWGSFNVCLPLDIKRTNRTSRLPRQAILRFPLPFRCGEEYSPGNVEEKLRCEAATYIWLQQNCPSIPTPRLLAIGLPGAESVGGYFPQLGFFTYQEFNGIRNIVHSCRARVFMASAHLANPTLPGMAPRRHFVTLFSTCAERQPN
jgi:hypothetical protein